MKPPLKLIGPVTAAAVSLATLAACSGGDATATRAPASTPMQSPEPAAVDFSEFTEELTGQSQDGFLFDLFLTHEVADSDEDRSLRDEVEVLSPDTVEFQGIFPSGDAHMLIISCFAEDCQEGDNEASFTVRYNRVGTD